MVAEVGGALLGVFDSFLPQFFPGGGPCAGAIVKMSGKDSGVGGTIIYFFWDDCLVEPPVRRRKDQLQRGELSIGQYGLISLLLDPEGNRIGRHSMA